MPERPAARARPVAAAWAAVYFDLDGTLVDSLPDIHHHLAEAFTAAGAEPPDRAAVRATIGGGSRDTVASLLGRAADDPLVDRVLADYLARYAAAPAALSRPVEGALDVLAGLHAAGVPMAVVTNKLEHLARQVLDDLGLGSWLPTVIGHDTAARPKPDAAPVHAAAAALGVVAADGLLVGDSRTDVATARAAGCTVWALDGGYNHGAPVADAGPDRLIESLRALL